MLYNAVGCYPQGRILLHFTETAKTEKFGGKRCDELYKVAMTVYFWLW